MSKFLSDELLEDITGGRCGVGDSVRKISQQWLEVSQKRKHAMFKSKSPEARYDLNMCMYKIKSNISLTLNPVPVSVLLFGQRTTFLFTECLCHNHY